MKVIEGNLSAAGQRIGIVAAVIEGNLSAAGQRIGIVAARFNEFITSKLLGGAEDSFLRHGGAGENLEVAWVPGAFEIPFVARSRGGLGTRSVRDSVCG